MTLAPLQKLMLRDSLAGEGSGNHIEQLEITFNRELDSGRLAKAWAETVAATTALQMAFALEPGALGWEIARHGGEFCEEATQPGSWSEWRKIDRRRQILVPGTAPWRVTWWPEARRLIWTFHHALLDGRSIARVVQNFLIRLGGGVAKPLVLAEWQPPTPAAVALAEEIFRESFAGLESAESAVPVTGVGTASRSLGGEFAHALEAAAATRDYTPAAALTWAWGQALAKSAGADAVLLEQVRAGLPQPGRAGFTMNTLPVLVHRAAPGSEESALRNFRRQLLALRAIEQVSPDDLPPGIFPNMQRSSVIMIERGDLQHQVGAAACGNFVSSLRLDEPPAQALTASARLLPDLQLEVEGPGRHALLDQWVRIIRQLVP
jgi:hypothetical protein